MEKEYSVTCSFAKESSLYLAYMPFIKGGGLFIKTEPDYFLGDTLHLKINLMAESEPYEVNGLVVWITPRGAQGNRPQGVGVQFIGENSRYFTNKIETYLAGMLKSSQITDTI